MVNCGCVLLTGELVQFSPTLTLEIPFLSLATTCPATVAPMKISVWCYRREGLPSNFVSILIQDAQLRMNTVATVVGWQPLRVM